MSTRRSAANILVTGGAGYIGSHTCKALSRAGFCPVTYDNLSNGARESVKWGPLEVGDLHDVARLSTVLFQYQPLAVMHFAASIEVADSISNPGQFYFNNVGGTLAVLHAMRAAHVTAIVFSSTAAVYGVPSLTPIPEEHPLHPVNPYGASKALVEKILSDIAIAEPLQFTSLRYFNAAGADPDGELGENHKPETHLIPIVIQSALGLRNNITIYGTDYDTPDGTCVRDFVHVTDLADAHVRALNRLLAGGGNLVVNLGTGHGHSVLEVINMASSTLGLTVGYTSAGRRDGDPPILTANASRAAVELGWHPRFDLEAQLTHAAASMMDARRLHQSQLGRPKT